MKKLLLFICFITLCLGLGCGTLFPKKVEFFQDKVKPVPVQTEKSKETDRQAAQYVVHKVDQAFTEAVRNDVTNSVVNPLVDAKEVAGPLSDSLGPPKKPWEGAAVELANQVNLNLSKLNSSIQSYRSEVRENEGKKIEGSGVFQVNYFVWLLIVGGGLLIVYIIIKSVIQALMISSGAGIPLSIGLKSVTGLASKNVRAGFQQIMHGIEKTKDHLKNSNKTTFTKEEVLELIRDEQMKSQSPEIQKIVKELTHN